MASVKPIPAPVGGWNDSDSWDNMPETDAIKLDNWFPSVDGVISRNGHEEYNTGLDGNVETIAEYRSATQVQMICATDNGYVYNCSSVAEVQIGSGFTNGQWQTINKNNKMVLVNGEDAPQEWDGTTLSALTISGSGLTVANLISCTTYSSRAWYVEKDTANVWYSAVDVIGGALTKFPVGNLGISGGYLVQVDTWTRDGGDGADDLLVLIMSSGEIFIYAGDPASTFSLIGKFQTANPMSTRCTIKYGANLWVITRAGVISLQSIMALGSQSVDKAITNKIKNAFRFQADTFGIQFGWQGIYYPRKEMVIFNIPFGVELYKQFVVNTLTGSWCSFSGMNAWCWGTYNGDLYFGGLNTTYKADTGYDDDGDDIVCDGITAFTYLGSPAQKKQVTMVQASLRLDGDLADNITIGADFELPETPSDINITQQGGTPWGSPWGSPWSGSPLIDNNYTQVSAWGYNVAMRLMISTNSQTTKWYSTRWIFKLGGLV